MVLFTAGLNWGVTCCLSAPYVIFFSFLQLAKSCQPYMEKTFILFFKILVEFMLIFK